jgi:CBS domain-containing protein
VIQVLSKIRQFGIHFTWVFMIALLTAIITTQFSSDYPLWQRLVLGLVVAGLFLLMTIVREFILSLAVFHRGNPFRKMTLFVFGAVYQENREKVATTHLVLQFAVKYLSNLVIAAIFYGLYATSINAGNTLLAGIAQWLTYLFAILFLLHFIPAFPLDGGDILRMWLWRSSGNYYQSTHLASVIGWSLGLLFVFGGGLVFILTRLWLISLLIVVFGWILTLAAGAARRRTNYHLALQNIKAEDLMTSEYPVVNPAMNIQQLVRDQVLIKGWLYIIIIEEDRLVGLLTLPQIKSLPIQRWKNTLVGDLMTPLEQIYSALPQQTADVLFDEMSLRKIDYVPVIQDGSVIGVVTRTALNELFKIRRGFGI